MDLSVAPLLEASLDADTTPEFARLVEDRSARMAPEERVRVCTEMFDTAQALAAASMRRISIRPSGDSGFANGSTVTSLVAPFPGADRRLVKLSGAKLD